MFRLALAFCLGLVYSVSANAQETIDNTQWFMVKQECMPIQDFMTLVVGQWGEQALFTGEGVTIGVDDTPYNGGVMLLVNQQTGTWTLGTLYGNGYVCINAAGTEFAPYTP